MYYGPLSTAPLLRCISAARARSAQLHALQFSRAVFLGWAALQRSTLANLPQLVGSGASQQTSKGVRTGIHYRHAKPRYSLSLAFLVVFFPFVGFLEILFRAKMLRLGWPGMFGNYLQLYIVTLFARC